MQGLVYKLVVLQTYTTDILNNCCHQLEQDVPTPVCVVVALFYSITLANEILH